MKTSKSSNLCSYKKFYILSTIIYAIACAWVMVAYCTEGQSGLVVCPSKIIYHIPCPGCGMTFGYSDRQFIAHINRCEALQGKMILKDEYDNLSVKDDDMNAKSAKL